MKIYMIGPSLYQQGGIVTVIQGLKHFLGSQGVSVSLGATTASGTKLNGAFAFLFTWLKLIEACILRRVDLVHLHMASRGSCLRKSLLAITCWILRIPFVIHLHGAEFRKFYGDELSVLGRFWVRLVFNHAARVIALSVAWQKWLETTLDLTNVTVVFNGVHSLDAPNEQRTIPTVLFLGRVSQRKGANELITAMRNVIQQVPGAVLEIGGDGDLDTYRKLAAGLPSVHFLGWVDDTGRAAALSRATVYCLPSWNEGLPMSVLEAMSAGLPVISTPVGGIPEAVEEGVTGLLVQPGDVEGLSEAICQLLLDPEKAKSMGKIGQARHREKFSTEAMGQGCLEVYASCLQRH